MKHILLLTILSVLFFSCRKSPEKVESKPTPTATKLAQSGLGMVAAAQPLATAAGNSILEAGGNAADAAVATAFVLAVVEPTMNGIGGRNQILVRQADGSFTGYNGMTEVPTNFVPAEEPPNVGYGTIATPGVVAALIRLHAEHGSMPWTELIKPAIQYAHEGFEVLEGEAARHAYALEDIKQNPGFREQMLKNDTITYEAGEILKQPDLAETLQRIAETNGEDFYQGETARKIAEDMAAHGGFVTETDLEEYQALDARHVKTTYRGYEIHSIPAPAGGGLVVKALNILEQFDLSSMTDAQWAAVVNQALAFAIESMEYDYKEEDLDFVQSKEWAIEKASEVTVPESVPLQNAAYNSSRNQLLASNTDWTGDTWGASSHHTTHFVTADCSGMVVSITQTIGPLFGSKVITPGLGFVYASTMGAYLSGADQAPGSRPRTTIAPTVVTKDGETIMVLGAAGGLRILSGIVQTISRFIDQGMSIEEAVAAPRIHPEAGTNNGKREVFPLKFSAEFTETNGWGATDSIYWQEQGFKPESITRYGAFARVHAIARDGETGLWTGMADLDWEGTADGPEASMCER
ncbi:MAG: gamma-glutamyltransferase [Bacteroidota bacterium]